MTIGSSKKYDSCTINILYNNGAIELATATGNGRGAGLAAATVATALGLLV